METKTKTIGFIETTATIVPTHSGMFKVIVIHRLPSGNFQKQEHDNLSRVSALGLQTFYVA